MLHNRYTECHTVFTLSNNVLAAKVTLAENVHSSKVNCQVRRSTYLGKYTRAAKRQLHITKDLMNMSIPRNKLRK